MERADLDACLNEGSQYLVLLVDLADVADLEHAAAYSVRIPLEDLRAGGFGWHILNLAHAVGHLHLADNVAHAQQYRLGALDLLHHPDFDGVLAADLSG